MTQLTQHVGHFEPGSIQAAAWPGTRFAIILPDDVGADAAQAICGSHGIIVESKPVTVTLQHDDMLGRLLDFGEIAARAPDILDQTAPVQAAKKSTPRYIKLDPHHVYAVFDGWHDALKAVSGETCRVDYTPTETGFSLVVTPKDGKPITIAALDQTRDRIAPMW